MLRVRLVLAATADGSDVAQIARHLESLPSIDEFAGLPLPAPVIILPNVFEAAFCQQLMDLYDRQGGTEFGVMRERRGKTTHTVDYGHKRRSDYAIEDEALRQILQQKVRRRVIPAIRKVHPFTVTRMERSIIGCYDSANGGHFRPHRDNRREFHGRDTRATVCPLSLL